MEDNKLTNKQLKSTIQIENDFYNINAVYSEEAGKVTNPLLVKESGTPVFRFDGRSLSTDTATDKTKDDSGNVIRHIVDYVPADKGGTFANPIYLSNPTEVPAENEVITNAQVNNKVVNLTGAPLCVWSSLFNPADPTKNLFALTDSSDKVHNFTVITGTENDLYMLQDAINGEYDHINQVTNYKIVSSGDHGLGIQTGSLDSSISGIVKVPGRYAGTYDNETKSDWLVRTISATTFKSNTKITGIIIEEAEKISGAVIKTIEAQAFYGCSNLKFVTIPNSVMAINSSTFEGCSKLEKIILGASTSTIGSSAFKGCSKLASIIIPKSVTSIASDAFANCPNLKTVYYTGSESNWNSININGTGNDQIKSAQKVYNSTLSSQTSPSTPNARVDITAISNSPILYICEDEESTAAPASNKIFLRLPGDTEFTEVSKGAARLESPDGATTSGFYTYESLAAIIAGINSRLAALGSTTLTLPSAIEDKGYVLIPEIADEAIKNKVLVSEDVVPTVQQLEEAIAKIQGKDLTNIADIISNNSDSLVKVRDDLDALIAEVEFELDGNNIVNGIDSRLDSIDQDISDINDDISDIADGTTPAGKAVALYDAAGTDKLLSTAENVPVYFSAGKPVACGSGSTAGGSTDNLPDVPINVTGTSTALWDTTNDRLFNTTANVPVYFENGVPKPCGTGTNDGNNNTPAAPVGDEVGINISGYASSLKVPTDQNGTSSKPVYFGTDGKPTPIGYSINTSVPKNAVFVTTAYTDNGNNIAANHLNTNVVTSSRDATINTSSQLTNGNVYLNNVENNEVTSSHKISGDGATSVTTDTSGNIIITSTDTKNTAGSNDTSEKIYLVGTKRQTDSQNPSQQTYSHDTVYVDEDGYLHSGPSATQVSLVGHEHAAYKNQNAFGKITVTNDSTNTVIEADQVTDTLTLVAGTNITLTAEPTDDKVTIAAAKYSANRGLSMSTSNAIGHTNEITGDTISANSTSTTENTKDLNFGGSITIPSITYDDWGHITRTSSTTLTMPINPNTDQSVKQTAVDTNGSDSNNYPLLFSSKSTNTITSAKTYETKYNKSIYANPKTGTITATTFNGTADIAVSAGSASYAGYAAKIGSADKDGTAVTEKIGDLVKPVYVNASGEIKPCSYTVPVIQTKASSTAAAEAVAKLTFEFNNGELKITTSNSYSS